MNLVPEVPLMRAMAVAYLVAAVVSAFLLSALWRPLVGAMAAVGFVVLALALRRTDRLDLLERRLAGADRAPDDTRLVTGLGRALALVCVSLIVLGVEFGVIAWIFGRLTEPWVAACSVGVSVGLIAALAVGFLRTARAIESWERAREATVAQAPMPFRRFLVPPSRPDQTYLVGAVRDCDEGERENEPPDFPLRAVVVSSYAAFGATLLLLAAAMTDRALLHAAAGAAFLTLGSAFLADVARVRSRLGTTISPARLRLIGFSLLALGLGELAVAALR